MARLDLWGGRLTLLDPSQFQLGEFMHVTLNSPDYLESA
jgi:hypothetical protein